MRYQILRLSPLHPKLQVVDSELTQVQTWRLITSTNEGFDAYQHVQVFRNTALTQRRLCKDTWTACHANPILRRLAMRRVGGLSVMRNVVLVIIRRNGNGNMPYDDSWETVYHYVATMRRWWVCQLVPSVHVSRV